MNAFRLIPIALALLAAPAAARPADGPCAVAGFGADTVLKDALRARAVEAVNQAAGPAGDDTRLAKFVAPTARFTLGVGKAAQFTGTASARVFAREMSADSFRIVDQVLKPALIDNPCSTWEVDVDFINSARKVIYSVTFTFEGGRIVKANGWGLSFQTGPIARIRD